MTEIRATIDGQQAGATFARALGSYPEKVRAAARLAVKDMAKEIEENGRADIQAAGRFGSRWTSGFQATVTEGGGNIKVAVTEAVPYWTVFEYGADISAKNPSGLLWIQIDPDNKVWPKDYPGRLFRVERSARSKSLAQTAPKTAKMLGKVKTLAAQFSTGDKAPLLMDASSKRVVYFGKSGVTIPQKFHLRRIVADEMKRLPLLFRDHLEG
ncbi:MAG TPA: HK97 gp10 family phage protein [Caulobacteraceae bacterium]